MSTIKKAINAYREIEQFQNWSTSKSASLSRCVVHLGNLPLSAADDELLVSWALSYTGSIRTAHHMLATLAGAIRYCARRRKFEIPFPNSPKDAITTLKEIGALQIHARNPPRITPELVHEIRGRWQSKIPFQFVEILIETPMRSGELCRIRWDDVDLLKSCAIIRDRKHPTRKQGNDQTIPLLGRTVELLAEIRAPGPLVCPHDRDLIYRSFKDASRALELDLRLHDLRHEGISRLFERGFTIPYVQTVSGHTSWQTLQKYTHITAQQVVKFDTEQTTAAPVVAEIRASSAPKRLN